MTHSSDAWLASISPDEALAGMKAVQDQAVVLVNTLDEMTFEIGLTTVQVILGELSDQQGADRTADFIELVKRYREDLNIHEEAYWRLYAVWSGLATTTT